MSSLRRCRCSEEHATFSEVNWHQTESYTKKFATVLIRTVIAFWILSRFFNWSFNLLLGSFEASATGGPPERLESAMSKLRFLDFDSCISETVQRLSGSVAQAGSSRWSNSNVSVTVNHASYKHQSTLPNIQKFFKMQYAVLSPDSCKSSRTSACARQRNINMRNNPFSSFVCHAGRCNSQQLHDFLDAGPS